ncbi:hypothetical protein B0T18DRAFT_473839 [Schizothecium vesticola]|uniref:Uncharacterized protein n=1 Tax=Schizothecium vesticola TaxID=314040 RepID=A0AA40BPD1_9PEZI|nr:hypothetical protein B0T18DRAFT_473839 [Schizothecium vesticola]
MASYHRVLEVFDRSIDQKSVECDYDIHPWDILINGERWSGKVRLVGFVDSFFLICYSGQSRFEHGLMIYKLMSIITEDDDIIRTTLLNAGVEPEALGLEVVNQKRVDEKNEPKAYFSFTSERHGLDYTITTLGHPIGLTTEYPASSLAKYTIKLRKGRDAVMKKRIRRGVTQHDLPSLLHDALRLGVITHAELIGTLIGKTVGGSTLEDVSGKYLGALAGAKGNKNLALSGERT